jgi:hypothetical protein
MIELKNSKITELGITKGRRRTAIDGFIGAVQMLDPTLGWQDIKPRLIRDTDGWHTEGTPYYAEIKDSGDRLFCPDKYERSKYIRLPSIPLFTGLNKTVLNCPTKLDQQLLPSVIRMPTSYGEIGVQFTNTGMYLPLALASAPMVSSKEINRLTLNVDSNIDFEKMLLPGYLRDAKGVERKLEWSSFKDGQIELGFDLFGLTYPITLVDAIDVQVGASADDGWFRSNDFSATDTQGYVGYLSGVIHSFYRFTGISGIDGTTNTDVANIQVYVQDNYLNPLTKLYADESAAAPAAPTTYTQANAANLTEAGVDWDDANLAAGAFRTSPSFVAPIEEIKGLTPTVILVYHKDDGSDTGATNAIACRSWNYSGNISGAKIHIEVSAGGAYVPKIIFM